MDKEVRQLLRGLPEGFQIERRPSGHYALLNPSGTRVYSLPSTIGRGRAIQNLRAALRREGVI